MLIVLSFVNLMSCMQIKIVKKKKKNEWLIQIKRENLPKLQHRHVCSDHFENSCFEVNLKRKLLPGKKTKRYLKKDAVPTLFPHKKGKGDRLVSVEETKRFMMR